MSTANIVLSIIVGLGLLGGLGYGLKAWIEKKLIDSQASGNQATATAVIVSAARELVDPLREELAKERKEHAEVIEMERQNVARVRVDLEEARKECEELRKELIGARTEMHNMREELIRLNREAAIHREEIERLSANKAKP